MHSYAHGHHHNVLKHFIYIQFGCEKQSKVANSLNDDITVSFTLDSDPEMPLSDLALSQCNRVMVHLYAHGHHKKVLTHLIHIQYRCEKQSKVVISLNHDITASFTLDSDPEMPLTDLALSQCNRVMVHSYTHGHH